MVRPFPNHVTDHFQSLPLAIGLFVSVFAVIALCAKRATKSPKCGDDDHDADLYEVKSSTNGSPMRYNKVAKSSPLSTPKRFLSNISNLKANKKIVDDLKEDGQKDEEKDTLGEGLWQKNILMGEKCQPLEFSGVIYYDNSGNRISEIPRSPRASAASLQGSFSFPVSCHSGSDMN